MSNLLGSRRKLAARLARRDHLLAQGLSHVIHLLVHERLLLSLFRPQLLDLRFGGIPVLTALLELAPALLLGGSLDGRLRARSIPLLQRRAPLLVYRGEACQRRVEPRVHLGLFLFQRGQAGRGVRQLLSRLVALSLHFCRSRLMLRGEIRSDGLCRFCVVQKCLAHRAQLLDDALLRLQGLLHLVERLVRLGRKFRLKDPLEASIVTLFAAQRKSNGTRRHGLVGLGVHGVREALGLFRGAVAESLRRPLLEDCRWSLLERRLCLALFSAVGRTELRRATC